MDCKTIPMMNAAGNVVRINAHEADSIAAWRKLGYVPESEIPVVEKAEKPKGKKK